MRIRSIRSAPFVVCALLAAAAAAAQTPLGTAFTYQGRLTDGGTPVSGSRDLEFRLFDSAAGATQIGPTVPVAGVPVALGLFTVELDFGAGAFAGNRRWLQIGVRTAGSGGPYTPLAPRQLVAPAPNAVYASTAGTVLVEADPKVGATTSGQWCVTRP